MNKEQKSAVRTAQKERGRFIASEKLDELFNAPCVYDSWTYELFIFDNSYDFGNGFQESDANFAVNTIDCEDIVKRESKSK